MGTRLLSQNVTRPDSRSDRLIMNYNHPNAAQQQQEQQHGWRTTEDVVLQYGTQHTPNDYGWMQSQSTLNSNSAQSGMSGANSGPPPIPSSSQSWLQALKERSVDIVTGHPILFQMLHEACQPVPGDQPGIVLDLLFLVVHQMLCRASTDSAKLSPRIWSIPAVKATLGTLQEVVTGFPRDHPGWAKYSRRFEDFPTSSMIEKISYQFQIATADALNFMHWTSANLPVCMSPTRPPPDINQIRAIFPCPSPHLHRAIELYILQKRGLRLHCYANPYQHAPLLSSVQGSSITTSGESARPLLSTSRGVAMSVPSSTQISFQATPVPASCSTGPRKTSEPDLTSTNKARLPQTQTTQTHPAQTHSCQILESQPIPNQNFPNQIHQSQCPPNQTLPSQSLPNQIFQPPFPPNQAQSNQSLPVQSQSNGTPSPIPAMTRANSLNSIQQTVSNQVNSTSIQTTTHPKTTHRPKVSQNPVRSPQTGQFHPLPVLPSQTSDYMSSDVVTQRRTVLQQIRTSSLGVSERGQVRSAPPVRPSQAGIPLVSVQSNTIIMERRPDTFFPAPGIYAPQVVPPEPDRFVLHQSHLREPVIACPQIVSPGSGVSQRSYQYLDIVRVLSKRITQESAIVTFDFGLKIPSESHLAMDSVPRSPLEDVVRTVTEKTRTFRLRCVRDETALAKYHVSTWAVMDTAWPPYVFFEMNGKRLEAKQKAGYGKEIPIDITRYVRNGANRITAYANMKREERSQSFSLAIEFVRMESHESIKSQIARRVYSVSQTIEDILGYTKAGADDDIVFSKMKVGLFDPIMGSRIFDIPVRGPRCSHRECFDLETFLNSRPLLGPCQPSVVDCWTCPICRADARPNTLMLDEWMVRVRETLRIAGKLDTRFIELQSNGKWTIIEEKSVSTPAPKYRGGKRGEKTETSIQKQTRSPMVVDIMDES